MLHTNTVGRGSGPVYVFFDTTVHSLSNANQLKLNFIARCFSEQFDLGAEGTTVASPSMWKV